MGNLRDKLQKAGEVALRQHAKISARADAIIDREAKIEARTEEAFAPHEGRLGEAEAALSDLEHSLAMMTNGGPRLDPLPGTGGTSQTTVHLPHSLPVDKDGNVMG